MTLYDAFIDDIPLEIETIDDSFEVAIGRHELPNRDGALLENMGQKARTVSIRCYFWDSGAHATYNDHIALVNHLQDRELFTLVHPRYGAMEGMVERVRVRADDRELTAEVDLDFVENLRQDISEVEYEDVEDAADQAVINAQEELIDDVEDEASDELGAEAPGICDQVLDETKTVLEQYRGVSRKARLWLKKVSHAVGVFEAVLTEVTQPANSLIATITFTANLPGRVIGAIAKMVDRYVALYQTTVTTPSRFIRNLRAAIDTLIAANDFTPAMARRVRIAAAVQGGAAVAAYYADDETERQKLRRLEGQKTFDNLGRYLNPEIPEPVYTVNELEASLYETREMVQQALDPDGGRKVDSLKALARSLVDHVSRIKLEREKIVTVTLDNPMPLHLVCLRYGLDYHYADRIVSINSIPRPNAAGGNIRIYTGGGTA